MRIRVREGLEKESDLLIDQVRAIDPKNGSLSHRAHRVHSQKYHRCLVLIEFPPS